MTERQYIELAPPVSVEGIGVTDVLRTFITVIVGVVATIMVSVVIVGVAAVEPTSPVIDRAMRVWAQVILFAAGVSVEVRGAEALDPDQAYVIIANHRSAFDIMCLFVALPVPIRFLAKRELFSIPLFGTMLRSARMVPVDRSAADHATINKASGVALSRGNSLVVFAEGTRTTAEEAKAFKKGGFIIAQQHSGPILPVAMVGTGNILAPHGKIVHKADVTIAIADPISPKSAASENVEELVSTTRTIVLDNERRWTPEARNLMY